MSWKDEARRRYKENKQGARYKLQEGENTLRFMPSKEGPDAKPYAEPRMHYGVGPDELPVRCGKNEDGEGECWLCDEKIPELAKSASKQKRAQATALASKLVLLVQVSPVDDGKFGPPKPWTMDQGGPKAASTVVFSLLSSSKRNYEDPVKGYNVTIERIGTGLKSTYPTVTPDDKPSKVPSNILAQIKSFDELLRAYDEEDQKATYFGRARKDEDEEPEDVEEDSEPEEGTEPEEGEEGSEEELPEEGEEGFEEPEEPEEPELEEEPEPEEEESEPEPPRKPVKKTAPAPPAKKPISKPPIKKPAPPTRRR